MLIEEAFRLYVVSLGTAMSNRVYDGSMPENVTVWPVMTYYVIDGETMTHHGGSMGLGKTRIQTVCWSPVATQARNAGEELRLALHAFKGRMGGSSGVDVLGCFHKGRWAGYQPDRKLYARINDFELTHREAVLA